MEDKNSPDNKAELEVNFNEMPGVMDDGSVYYHKDEDDNYDGNVSFVIKGTTESGKNFRKRVYVDLIKGTAEVADIINSSRAYKRIAESGNLSADKMKLAQDELDRQNLKYTVEKIVPSENGMCVVKARNNNTGDYVVWTGGQFDDGRCSLNWGHYNLSDSEADDIMRHHANSSRKARTTF